MSLTKTKSTPFIYCFFISATSFLFFSLIIILVIAARFAAKTFSFIPPTGSTAPRNDISPVIATLSFNLRPVQRENRAVNNVTVPASFSLFHKRKTRGRQRFWRPLFLYLGGVMRVDGSEGRGWEWWEWWEKHWRRFPANSRGNRRKIIFTEMQNNNSSWDAGRAVRRFPTALPQKYVRTEWKSFFYPIAFGISIQMLSAFLSRWGLVFPSEWFLA